MKILKWIVLMVDILKLLQKITVKDRVLLSPKLAIELMRLTVVCGVALKEAMQEMGVHVERINYQDNGNWKPELHVHLYGRALDTQYQKYGNPIVPGHKEEYQQLTTDDIVRIHNAIEKVFKDEKFADKQWRM